MGTDRQALPDREARPPVFVSGGRRLNFSRRDMYNDTLGTTFMGTGKDDGCYPSCSWEELCAMAKLIVDHPAFRLPETVSTYSPPEIEDEESPLPADETEQPK